MCGIWSLSPSFSRASSSASSSFLRHLKKRGLVPGEGHDAEPIEDDDEQSLALAQSTGVRGDSSLCIRIGEAF